MTIDFTRKNEVQQLLPTEPLLSSHNAKWNGIHLEYYQHTANEVPEHAPKQHLILINTQVSDLTQYEQTLDNRLQHDQLREGHAVVVPANVGNRACWHTEHSYILLSIDPTVFRYRAFELTDSDEVDLIPHFSSLDPLLHGIGLALKTEIETEKLNGQFYLDSLTTTLIAHLLSHYTAKKGKSHQCVGSLSRQKNRKVIDYIHDNLDRDVSLAELAEIVQISPNYFATLFKQAMGISPHRYIIQCKINCAKQLLRDHEVAIADIAHNLGFSHQSHLNYHFKRLVGVTPKAFQKNQ
ncbi:AraC family transcriptional regulator [Halomicronema hongdechloris]|uniref:AraC family transcriptional regulator n=1 Tax=Halomicronema hongdechloris TaxID=1209493 RepID=UPI001651339C|nr:AraC family transcriptional regulator [Halomicronema hongdechloris]